MAAHRHKHGNKALRRRRHVHHGARRPPPEIASADKGARPYRFVGGRREAGRGEGILKARPGGCSGEHCEGGVQVGVSGGTRRR